MNEAGNNKNYEANVAFVNALCENMYSKAPSYYRLRRLFGQKPEDDLSAYMDMLSMGRKAEEKSGISIIKPYNEDVYFLVATMFCFMQNPDSKYVSDVKIEELIGRLYRKGFNSTNREIGALLDLDYNDSFRLMFVRLARRLKRELKDGERIDYAGLIKDLILWDSCDISRKWARGVIGSAEYESA